MSRFIPDKMRAFVAERADHICEYCLIHEDDLVFSGQIDHIISLKHGGPTHPDNLAYSCIICNGNKGSDVGSVLLPLQVFVRFFNPRSDEWGEHFELADSGKILPKTDIGQATAKILDFNASERVAQRKALMLTGKYPPFEALRYFV
ncbi:MAG: HNH endonuclease [Saprospiraceae bacterium]